MEKNIAVIYGDCASPEIVTQALRVLDAVAEKFGHTFTYTKVLMGGEAIDACGDLRILAESDIAGPMLLSTESGRQIFVIGHPEYDTGTLRAEYERDVNKGMDVPVPAHYFPNDDPTQEPVSTWRAHAQLLYTNWLNYYVYQTTPYDLSDLGAGE